MRLTDILKKENIRAHLKAKTKEEVIRELCDVVLPGKSGQQKEDVVTALLEREKISSTGIGEGVAIPHARVETPEQLVAAFGLTETPIEFSSLDGKPVKLAFLVLCPKDLPGLQIRFLARVSRLLNDKQLRDELLACESAEQVFDALDQYENKHFS